MGNLDGERVFAAMKNSLPIKGMALVFALASVLGLAFNRSNPLGIRDEEPPADASTVSSAAANLVSQRQTASLPSVEGVTTSSASASAPSPAAETHLVPGGAPVASLPTTTASPSGTQPTL